MNLIDHASSAETSSDQNHNDDVYNDGSDLLCVQHGHRIGGAVMGEPTSTRPLGASQYEVYRTWLAQRFSSGGTGQDELPVRIVQRTEVIMDGQYLPADDERNNVARRKDGNKGNFVWQYGATSLFNPYTTKFVKQKSWRTVAYVFASANLLLMNPDYPQGEEVMGNMAKIYTSRVLQYDLPTILLGIGIQVEFAKVQNVSSLSLEGYDVYQTLLQEIANRQESNSIAVRGDVTERTPVTIPALHSM